MAFDPDVYLASPTPTASSGFDPDAYLADKTTEQPGILERFGNLLQKPVSDIAKTIPYMAATNPVTAEGLALTNQFNNASEKLGGAVAGGAAQLAARYNINLPAAVPATLGAISQVASNPQSYMGGGVAAESTDELPLKTAQIREARTGVPARAFQRLYKDPGALFAKGDIEQAGARLGAAKQAAGINPGITEDISSLTPENVDRIKPTNTMKTDAIDNVISKISQQMKPTPQEAQDALNSINSLMKNNALTGSQFRQYTILKGHINDALQEAAPDVKQANSDYARLALRNQFSGMDALNKNGTPSKLALMAKGGSAGLGALFGMHAGGSPLEGGYVGYQAGKVLNQAYHAPYVAGLQTVAGAYANQAIDPLLNLLEKAGTSPAIQAYVAKYIQQKNQSNQP